METIAGQPLLAVALFSLGYLSGSVPYGLLLTKAAGLGDVRAIGSGNIGATNVLRAGSKKIAAATLLCDLLKGTIPVLLGNALGGDGLGLIAGLGAMAGHILPFWLGFKGGKGVATYVGILFGLYWPLGLAFGAVWLSVAALFRMSSLSGLVSTAAMVPVSFFLGKPALTAGLVILAAIIFITHRANISRILAGTEARIKLKSG